MSPEPDHGPESGGQGPTGWDTSAHQVAAALARLPPAERLVPQLAYGDRLTYGQIAGRMQQPVGEVCACASAGLRSLGLLLEQG